MAGVQPTVVQLRAWANRIGGGATRMVTGEAFPKHLASGFVDRPITPMVEAGDRQLLRVRSELHDLLVLDRNGTHATDVEQAIVELDKALTAARSGKVGGALELGESYLPSVTVQEIGQHALGSIRSLAQAARAVSDASSGVVMRR